MEPRRSDPESVNRLKFVRTCGYRSPFLVVYSIASEARGYSLVAMT